MEYFTEIKRSKVLVDVTYMMLSQVEQKTPDIKENHVNGTSKQNCGLNNNTASAVSAVHCVR